MEKLQSGIQTGEKQLISGAGRSEDGSDGSAVRGEYGPADVAVGGHGRQLPPDVMRESRLIQTVLNNR